LPYPIALYWLRARQAKAPDDVYKAAEGIVRALGVLLLADVVHAPEWPEELEKLLRGGADGRALEKPSFGRRIELLRHLAAAHAGVAAPLLLGVQEWWAFAGAQGGPLQKLVEARNKLAHGGGTVPEAEARFMRGNAQAHLTAVLKTATFLRDTQWLHLEGPVTMRRNRKLAPLRRLVGAAPYGVVREDAEWTGDFLMEEGFAYLGNPEGTRWRMMPWIALDHADKSGHPRPVLVDALDKKGTLSFTDALTGVEGMGRDLPDGRGDPLRWSSFLERRREVVPTWEQAFASPHKAFTFPMPPDLSDGLRPGSRLDDYQLIQKLGEGGAAVVWEVMDVHSKVPYALKVLKTEVCASEAEVARFEQELNTLKRLYGAERCTRVVGPIESLKVQDGDLRRVVMRMPLYPGTLKDKAAELRAAAGGANPDEAVVRSWLRMGLEALSQLHSRGVIHRDIKPSNFLVNEAGELFVSDLGVAKDDSRDMSVTRTGEVVGTDRYMPPEQRVASRTVTAKADVYSLGVCMDELWSGEVKVLPGKGLPGAMGELIRAMTSQDPDARPTAEEALALLASAKGKETLAPMARKFSTGGMPSVPAAAASPAAPAAGAPPAASRRGVYAGMGAALLVGGGAAAWMALRPPPAPPPPAAVPAEQPLPLAATPVVPPPTPQPVVPAAVVPAPLPPVVADAGELPDAGPEVGVAGVTALAAVPQVELTFNADQVAEVYEGEYLLGVTPFALVRDKGSAAELTFKARGFKPIIRKLRFESVQSLTLTFEREGRGPAARPATPAPAQQEEQLKEITF